MGEGRVKEGILKKIIWVTVQWSLNRKKSQNIGPTNREEEEFERDTQDWVHMNGVLEPVVMYSFREFREPVDKPLVPWKLIVIWGDIYAVEIDSP